MFRERTSVDITARYGVTVRVFMKDDQIITEVKVVKVLMKLKAG